MDVLISVVVCTRNRAQSLARTLDSISQSSAGLPKGCVETIVVDNGSTDETRDVVTSWFQTAEALGSYIVVKEPGVCRCKNAALRVVTGSVIFLTDDDCVLHADCLANLSLFARQKKEFIVGGRVELGDPLDLPVTIKTGRQPHVVSPSSYPGGALLGANLAFSADVYRLVGEFDETLGPGAPFIAAEDAEYVFRATKLGVGVFYEPAIAVDHFHGRRNHGEGIRLLKGYYYGDGAVYAKHIFRDKRIIGAIWADMKFAIKCIFVNVKSVEGVNRVGLFKFFHRTRGFASYFYRSLLR